MASPHLLFDLDATLYPPANGLMAALEERLRRYMVERLGRLPEEAAFLRSHYYERMGSAVEGLLRYWGATPRDVLEFVHGFPVEQYLRPEPQVAALLSRVAVPRSIFTNAPETYARRVLKALGLERGWQEIFALESFGYVGKPSRGAYARVEEVLGLVGPSLVLFDDQPGNLRMAQAREWRTVLVGSSAAASRGADFAVAGMEAAEPVLARMGTLRT